MLRCPVVLKYQLYAASRVSPSQTTSSRLEHIYLFVAVFTNLSKRPNHWMAVEIVGDKSTKYGARPRPLRKSKIYV